MSAALSIVPPVFENDFSESPESTGVRIARPACDAPEQPVQDVSDGDLRPLLPLVHKMAAALARRVSASVQKDDLVAAGMLGLLETFRNHGELRGTEQFEWCARVRIRGAMLDELRRSDWMSRRARAKERAARADGAAGHGHAMVPFDDLAESAHARLAAGQDSPLDFAERRSERLALERAVATLPDRERTIVEQHYFESVPFHEIAARFGVTQARVSQLHSRAMAALRDLFSGPEAGRVTRRAACA